MGTLKRIGNASQGEAQGKTTGGRLRRIDTGEIITYNPDPVRSLPQVSKITGGGQTASPSLPTLSDWSGGRRGEGNAAIAKVTELRDLRDEARQEFLNYRAASTAGITLGTPAAGEYTGRKYKSEQEAYDAWQKYKKETEDLEKENGLEEYSVGKSAAGALQKGLGQIAQFSGDTLALAEDIVLAPLELFGGDELGTISDTAPFNTWAKNIREEQEAVQEYYAPNAEKGGKAAQLFEDLGTGVVAAVPQAVLALLTGGTSAAAQSTAGLTRAATQAVSPGVATTIQNAVSAMAKDPQYWTSFAQVVGGSYEQALSDMIELEAQKETTAALTGTEYEPPENQSAMRVKAALYAIGNGLMNAAVEVGGGIQTLPDELKHGGSAWRAWVDSMVDEGKEEVVQGVIERALQNPMYGMDNPLFSTTDERAILNPVTAGEEFLGGAVVGGVLGGGQIGFTRGINAAARRAAEAQGRVQPRAATQQQTQDLEARAAEANLAELEQSAAAAGVTEADVKTAAEISRATGREIRFYDGNTRRDPSGRANGYFDGNTIYVNSRSANPVAQIISHELTHSVEMADAYRDLSALVFDRIQRDGGNLEKLRQEKRDLYDRMGAGLHSQEMVDQEIVAEYVEHNLLTNEQEILDLTRENPTLGQRIMDWIDRLLARLGNADAQERAFLTNARDTYARALEQTGTERAAGGQAMQAVTQTTETTTRPAGEEPAQATPRQQPAAEHPRQEQPAAPAQEEQRQRTREEIRQEVRSLREDYNAGRISDEEFDEALDAIMEEEGLEDVSMLGRYSFGGRNANRADLEALDRAQDMERRGVAADTIFRETGWFQGADGKWRFEIDDSGMEYSRWGDMNRSDRTEYARFRELEGKFIDGTITQEEQAELRSLLEEGHGPGRAEEQQTLRLSDFVRHDDLYQNYPQLRQASLRFADLPEGTYGTYNAETNTITLNNSLRDAPEDTLVHEIQHAIQNAEGFAAGASPDYWESARIDAETAASAARENLRLWLQDIGYLDYVRQSMDRVVAGEITLDQHWENLQRFKENSDRAREIAVSEEEVARYEERLREIDQMGMTARELYQNTAGEIEARDVTARRQLTPEQRRQTMPDTGDENTVFADSFGAEYSAEAAEPVDSQAFKDWFGDWTSGRAEHSQVVDSQGRPLIVYHGTGTNIEEFLPEFTGKGNDQYGSGFYFTTDRETAEGYTTRALNDQSKPGGTDNHNVIPAYLNIRNPLVVEARDTPNLYQIEVPASQAAKIIGKAPDIMDPENSILGDFFDDFWESGPKRSMINRLAREYDWTLGSLATDIFRDHPTEYRQAVRDVLGYDGVQVNFPNGEKHFVAWFPNQIKHATENSGAFSTGDNRIRYSISEPTDAQQEEADRLLFQGVDADTIREMTGLERTADGGWRFAVDTAQAAAYDGGRRTDQQGGMNSEYDTQGALGETARREVERAYPGRIRDGQTGNETDRTGDGRTQGPAEWARGHLIDRPSQAAGIAVENTGRYGADAFVVEDSAIKERSPGSWALTSGGRIYISDSVPADLADVVGYHEAIHAAKQTGNQQYRDFVDDVGGYIDFQSDRAAYVLGLVTEDRFPGKDLMDLSAAERETAYDELNALVWGYHKADPENARAQFADMFRDYDAYIADLDAAMESGAEPEVPGLSLPTLDDEDTRYSMDEDAAAEPSDNPLPTVDQKQEQQTERSYFDTLPRRVQNYLTRAENYLVAKVGNQLNVPRTAQRDYLKGIARKLTEEYLQQGRVSQETMDRMFDEAYDRGVIVDRDYYDEYKDLRDYLRKADLQISREDAADIQDFNDFRKSNFGRLKISTKSGRTNIDQVYMELQERWPEFFNEQRESTPGDQLVRMAEIAQSFQIAEKSPERLLRRTGGGLPSLGKAGL